MKKWVCVTLAVLVMLTGLTACSFTKRLANELADEAEATPREESMLTALVGNQPSDAKALMHPQVADRSDEPIAQMIAYLAGREIRDLELNSINVSTSAGTGGKARQEKLTYKVTLDEDEVIYLNLAYQSDAQGIGFMSFQVVLGIV